LIGGVIAYFAIRNEDLEMAERMLILGLIMTFFAIALTWIMILALMP
jgi:cytochrome bd-type quinol oxidase subunit 1